jgi:hypothetical protein
LVEGKERFDPGMQPDNAIGLPFWPALLQNEHPIPAQVE